MNRDKRSVPEDTWEEAETLDRMEDPSAVESFAMYALEVGPPSGFILDLGSGTGRVPVHVLRENLNLQIIVADTSLNRLKMAATNIAAVDLDHKAWIRHIDSGSLPFPDSTFDFVISNRFLHRLADPRLLLKDLRRVCKPACGILMRDWIRPDSDREASEWVAELNGYYDDFQIRCIQRALMSAFTMQEIESIIREAGFGNAVISRTATHHWSVEQRWSRP